MNVRSSICCGDLHCCTGWPVLSCPLLPRGGAAPPVDAALLLMVKDVVGNRKRGLVAFGWFDVKVVKFELVKGESGLLVLSVVWISS